MKLDFTPEQEAELARIAARGGMDTEHFVKDIALRAVEEDARYRAAVREGIAAAYRGEFVEHEQVWADIEKILRS